MLFRSEKLEIGKSHTVLDSDKKEVAIFSFGTLLDSAVKASKKFDAKVVDMRFIKPLDHKIIEEVSKDYKLVVTIEDNVIAGGAGSAVNEYLLGLNTNVKVLNLGLPDEFIEHGDQEQQKTLNGLDAAGIEKSIEEKLKLI